MRAFHDLVGVDVELPGKLRQRLVAAYGGERYLRLERRGVVTSGPSAHLVLRFLGPQARSQEQIVHSSRCPDFWGHLCYLDYLLVNLVQMLVDI